MRGRKYLFGFSICCLLITTVTSYVNVSFQIPTAVNGSVTSSNWSLVNVSVDEDNVDGVRFSWNGSETVFYDGSLLLGLNFNNNSAIGDNATVAKDISKHGNDCNAFNVSVSSSGRFGSAFYLNGRSYLDCGNRSSLDSTEEISVELWFKKKNLDVTLYNRLISYENSSFFSNFVVLFDTSERVYFQVRSNGTNIISGRSDPLVDDVWYHVVGVYNGSNVQLYLDGVLNATSLVTGTTIDLVPNRTLFIGRSGNPTLKTFNGTIDELRIYNRSLSAEEVSLHYQSELSRYNSSQVRLYVNVTGLSNGVYDYYAYANDTLGNTGQTETRTITVSV